MARALQGVAGVVAALLGVSGLSGCTPTSGGIVTLHDTGFGLKYVTFEGATGKRNDLTISLSASHLTISEATNLLTAGSGCSPAGTKAVRCPTTRLRSVYVELNDGNDRATSTVVPQGSEPTEVWLEGGSGDDVLNGGPGDDLLFGDGGRDTVSGGAGNDGLYESRFPGTVDELDADVYNGGSGRDDMTYGEAEQPVTVTVNGVADDGRPGERDNVKTDVEGVVGGNGGDTLVGDADADEFYGADGNDVIRGGGGDDYLHGADGFDTLDGGPASDICWLGGTGTDGGTAVNCESRPDAGAG